MTMRDVAGFDRIKEGVAVQLDGRQVSLAVLGCLVVCAAVFAAGVVVGQRMGDVLPRAVAELTGDDGGEAAQAGPLARDRIGALVALSPTTRAMDTELAGVGAEAQPDSPTEAARMEAHRQIAAARDGRSVRSLGPIPVEAADEAPKPIAPLDWVERAPGAPRAPDPSDVGWTLQVSAFRTEAPARVVADQLRASGHEAQVRALDSKDGEQRYRVEVGQFADARGAARFQRSFEQTAGYSTLVVAVR